MRSLFVLCAVGIAFPLVACANDSTSTNDDNEVKVNTSSAAARAQYDADVEFLNGYTPQCSSSGSGRPRVLLTGFGRFLGLNDNATGRIVSTLVPAASYPETSPPPNGQVDDPGSQLSVGNATLNFPGLGDVDVCAMILPVYWDMASILIAKEADAFAPSFVMMTGVAGDKQPIWIELGAANYAEQAPDGSNLLVPKPNGHDQFAKIVDSGDSGQPNLLSWNAVTTAARAEIARHQNETDGGMRFGDILPGAALAGFPRQSNTYLCNNTTYATGYMMNHPGQTVTLLKADPPLAGRLNQVDVRINSDLRNVPRVFVHWPTDLDVRHHEAGASIMKAIIGAQLQAIANGDAPTRGDTRNADPTLVGGNHF